MPTAPTYHARELLRLPNLLSAARIPLALAFPFVRGRLGSLAILAAAGVTDVLDGYFARRMGQASPLGAMVDGVADKVFSTSVVGTLLRRGMLSPISAALLASRELGELPLAARALARREAHLVRHDRKANVLGKLATTLELGTLVAALLGARHRRGLVVATAGLGALAAFSYWRREVRSASHDAAAHHDAHREAASPPRHPSSVVAATPRDERRRHVPAGLASARL